MKRQIRCVISAAVSVFLILGVLDYAFDKGEENQIQVNPAREAAQSDNIIVQDYIHDNYVINERNPWTDYNLHPVEYSNPDIPENFDGKISAGAAILINVDSKTIIYGKNTDKKMYPASTTKLMTALTVLQVMDTDEVVTVGDEVNMIASDSSKAGFQKGQIVTVQELMEGLLISSGNDAAYILAKASGEKILKDNIANEGKKFSKEQCVRRFVFEMNKNVRDMNLKNTNFTSPDGYDDKNQYTTASDLSKIAIEAYGDNTIMEICKMDKKHSDTLNKTWTSTNELLNKGGKYYNKYCLGMKTGSTDLAGKCLVSAAEKGDITCISVVLDDNTDEQRWDDSYRLLNYGLKWKVE